MLFTFPEKEKSQKNLVCKLVKLVKQNHPQELLQRLQLLPNKCQKERDFHEQIHRKTFSTQTPGVMIKVIEREKVISINEV